MQSNTSRISALLVVSLAGAFSLMAQRVAPEDSAGWARPPIRVMPADTRVSAGSSPSQMRTAYGVSQLTNQGEGQTIALIDAYDNPDAESDLATFSTRFSLPACTTANGCFKKIYATGTKPAANANWSGESSLDIEWAHGIAPKANIILVEASSSGNKPLWQAVDVAVQNGATVVSMSFGGKEYSAEITADTHFNVPGVVFCASSGDSGHHAYYPAASPYVVSVGGTVLQVTSSGAWQSETAWSSSSGGSSTYETEPSYQSAAQNTGKRGIPDVAYLATSTIVYSKYGFGGWTVVAGTSISSPEFAALFAIANSMRVANGKSTLTQPQNILYGNTADFHDITSGSNGSCGAQCRAVAGYDFVTGIGSPKANVLIPALVAAP